MKNRGLVQAVYGVIIVATILVFVIQFRPNSNQKTGSIREACAATVKGFCIDPKSHRASYRVLIPRDQSGNLLTERAKSMGLNKIALDGLIERELLIDEAERVGLSVSEDEANQAVLGGFIYVSVPMENPRLMGSLNVRDGYIYAGFKDQKTKQWDMKVYERSVRMITGRSPTEFKEWQQRELLAAKMRDLVRAPVRVSDREAFELYVSEKGSATVTYVPVLFEWVDKFVLDKSPAAIAEWAKDKSNAAQAKDAELRHILIRADSDAGAEGKEKAQKKAQSLIARLNAGEDFANLAQTYSQDPGSARTGGELGTKTDGFVKPFKDAADALRPGEMTQTPIETQFGFHIIKKDDPISTAYKKAKSLEAAKDLANKIAASIKSGMSPDDAVKAAITPYVKPVKAPPKPVVANGDAGAPDTSFLTTADQDATRPRTDQSSPFNRGGDPIPALSPEGNEQVVKFAFSGAKDGELMKEPFRAEEGFYVVMLKSRKEATHDEFDKDRDVYLQTILAAKQAEALSLYVRRLREAAKADIKIDENYLNELAPKTDGGVAAPEDDDEGEGP